MRLVPSCLVLNTAPIHFQASVGWQDDKSTGDLSGEARSGCPNPARSNCREEGRANQNGHLASTRSGPSLTHPRAMNSLQGAPSFETDC